MKIEKDHNKVDKKTWRKPELIEYGDVAEITLAAKSWGSADGAGLEPGLVKPSL